MDYHIMIDDKFIDGFIDDVKKIGLSDNSVFFIRGQKDDARYVKSENVSWIHQEHEIIQVINSVTTQDKLFVHWYDYNIGRLCVNLPKEIPLYVIFWGGEFYEEPVGHNYSFLFDKRTYRMVKPNKFKFRDLIRLPIDLVRHVKKVKNYKTRLRREFELKKRTVQRINFLVYPPNSDSEVELVKKMFDAPGITYKEGFYNQNFNYAQHINLDGNNGERSDQKIILIGNSATPSNNHIDCLHRVKEIDSNEFEILCPLSYGEDYYRDVVISEGKKLFGNRFKPMTQFFDRKEYLELLNKVDIGIFFHNRSQAFGNIVALLSLGKKVYLKSKNPFYLYLSAIGVKIFAIDADISSDDFFKPLRDAEIEQNLHQLNKNLSDETRLKCLEKLLKGSS